MQPTKKLMDKKLFNQRLNAKYLFSPVELPASRFEIF
jgi:hypothetical protein